MSGALSLEQVLARSLRAPKRRPGGGFVRLADGPVPRKFPPAGGAESVQGVVAVASGEDPIVIDRAEEQLTASGATPINPLQGTKPVLGFSKQQFPKKPQLGLFKNQDRRRAEMVAQCNASSTGGASAVFRNRNSTTTPSGSSSGWMSSNVFDNLQDKTAVLFSSKRLGDWQTALSVLGSIHQQEQQSSSATTTTATTTANGGGEGSQSKSSSSTPHLSETQLGVITDTCIECSKADVLKEHLLQRLASEPFVAPTPTPQSHSSPGAEEEEQRTEGEGLEGSQERKKVRNKRTSSSSSTSNAEQHPLGERLLNKVLDHFGRSGETEEVIDLVSRLSPERRSVNVLNGALASFESRGEWHRALDWFHEHYNAVPLESAAAVSAMKDAEDSVGKDGASAQNNPPNPNVVTFATLMAILESAGRVKESQELLHYFVPVDQRSAIMSSYAALIVVWSQRHGSKGIKKF